MRDLHFPAHRVRPEDAGHRREKPPPPPPPPHTHTHTHTARAPHLDFRRDFSRSARDFPGGRAALGRRVRQADHGGRRRQEFLARDNPADHPGVRGEVLLLPALLGDRLLLREALRHHGLHVKPRAGKAIPVLAICPPADSIKESCPLAPLLGIHKKAAGKSWPQLDFQGYS